VVDLDRSRVDAQHRRGLEHPRELALRGAAETTEEDVLERVALALVGALVHVQVKLPGRAWLVVLVVRR
jgi:hypothetical protein